MKNDVQEKWQSLFVFVEACFRSNIPSVGCASTAGVSVLRGVTCSLDFPTCPDKGTCPGLLWKTFALWSSCLNIKFSYTWEKGQKKGMYGVSSLKSGQEILSVQIQQ